MQYWPERLLPEDDSDDSRYDFNRDDSRQYCKHGTFIGSWAGPDLMCLDCELEP